MEGRGRVTSFDLLPPEADEDVLWVCGEFYARKRPTSDIHVEFNERLAAKGIEPIKRTAFYEQAARLSQAQRKLRDSRALFAGLADQFTAENVDEHTVALGEFLKAVIQEVADDGAGRKSSKEIMELAKAYQATVSAQKISSERRQKLQKEMAEGASKAVETVARAKGLSSDVADLFLEAMGVPVPAKATGA